MRAGLQGGDLGGTREVRYLNTLNAAKEVYVTLFTKRQQEGYTKVHFSSLMRALASRRTPSKLGQSPRLQCGLTYGCQALWSRGDGVNHAPRSARPRGCMYATPCAAFHFVLTRHAQSLFAEATHWLERNLNGKVTNAGIETPLGTLALSQVEKAEAILLELLQETQSQVWMLFCCWMITLNESGPTQASSSVAVQKLTQLFYATIPHHVQVQSER